MVSDMDVPLLNNTNLRFATNYLSTILNAESGNTEAANIRRNMTEQAFLTKRAHFLNPYIPEDDYLIPSTSSAFYKEELISDKGTNLIRLSNEGYPVPDFVVLTSSVYHLDQDARQRRIEHAIQTAEKITGQEFSGATDPLYFALRCAMPQYIPGVMPTYLNVGITEQNLPHLADTYGETAALRTFLNNLKNLLMAVNPKQAKPLTEKITQNLTLQGLESLIGQFATLIGKRDKRLLTDPIYQTAFLVAQAYKSYNDNLDLLRNFMRGAQHYPSIILQKMVCTVRGDDCYSGVLYSRHSKTGIGMEMESARNVFGEDIMTGTVEPEETHIIDPEDIKETHPAIYHIAPLIPRLEASARSPVTIEFVTDGGLFAMLQINNSDLTGNAVFPAVMGLHKAGTIDDKRVLELVQPYHIRQVLSDSIERESLLTLQTFCEGTAVLPRTAVSGKAYFEIQDAVAAKRKGEKVILIRDTFVPTDTIVMEQMDGIVSLGPAAIHIITNSQRIGVPALINIGNGGATLGSKNGPLCNSSGLEIRKGDAVTISSRQQKLFKGEARFSPSKLALLVQGKPLRPLEEENEDFQIGARAFFEYQTLANNANTIDFRKLLQQVKFDFSKDTARAQQAVRNWFETNMDAYLEEVFKSNLGDHRDHGIIFQSLSLEQKVRLLKAALKKCAREKICGYYAGSFVLGNYLVLTQPIAFWKSFTPAEIAMLINEWILHEKYIYVLSSVGEREVSRARKMILTVGLGSIIIHRGSVGSFMTLKLGKINLRDVAVNIPDWYDPQTLEVVNILQNPYSFFFDFTKPWDKSKLEKLCKEENVSIPKPNDI